MPPHDDSSESGLPAAAGCFGTTHWSVVLAAGEGESAKSRQALEKLCRTYWRPIYIYVRRRGHAPPEAEDCTQAFFAHFLERKLLTVVDRQRGRFRTFVLHACEYFLAKQWRDANRLKRGGGQKLLSLDLAAAEDGYEPADQSTPERLYERQWGLALLDLTLDRLRQEWAAAGKETLFATLQIFLSGERKSITCAQAALRLGISEGAVRTAAHRLRQRYGEILRSEVAQTLSRPEDLENELRHLLSAL